MGRYLVLWEVDRKRLPDDPKEAAKGMTYLMDITKKDIQRGIMKEWGTFLGEFSGFNVVEGSEVEIGKMIQKYLPYVNVKLRPILTVTEVDEMIKGLSK